MASCKQHRVIRTLETFTICLFLVILYMQRYRIIIVYTIKITLKYLCLRHINTKKIPTPLLESGFFVYRKGRAPYPIVLKKIT